MSSYNWIAYKLGIKEISPTPTASGAADLNANFKTIADAIENIPFSAGVLCNDLCADGYPICLDGGDFIMGNGDGAGGGTMYLDGANIVDANYVYTNCVVTNSCLYINGGLAAGGLAGYTGIILAGNDLIFCNGIFIGPD